MEMGERRSERLDRGIKVRTEGIYAISSWQEMNYLLVPRLALILGMLVLPLVMPPYWQRVISYVCIYALLSLGFDFLAHFVGLVSLGGALFVGVGGYLAAILNTSLGLPISLSIRGGNFLHSASPARPPSQGCLLRHREPYVPFNSDENY
jgi:branched-chain amino acid transport system permease protein